MNTNTMLARFEGDGGRRRLLDVLKKQAVIAGDEAVALAFADVAELLELAVGDVLIQQDAADNDCYFVLMGKFRVMVHDRVMAERGVGNLLGEMAIADPSARRTATIAAAEASVVARISEADFVPIADAHPKVWREITRELCRRLDERKKFATKPNVKPIIFIGSSSEQLAVAEAVRDKIPSDVADVILWSQDVFGASEVTIESLENQLAIADFALLIASPDDQVSSRKTRSKAPRDNVVFELGLFMGDLKRRRTFVLQPSGVPLKLPSDLFGMTTLRYDPTVAAGVAVEAAVASIVEKIKKLGPR